MNKRHRKKQAKRSTLVFLADAGRLESFVALGGIVLPWHPDNLASRILTYDAQVCHTGSDSVVWVG